MRSKTFKSNKSFLDWFRKNRHKFDGVPIIKLIDNSIVINYKLS